MAGTPPNIRQLLDFHFGAGFFELLFGGIGVGLVRAFEQRLRSAFDQRLGFRQAEAGFDFTHGFDRRDLLVRRNGDKDQVKRIFRSRGSRSCACGTTCGGNRDGRGGGNAPLGFKLFHQVSGFENRQLAQFFHDVC